MKRQEMTIRFRYGGFDRRVWWITALTLIVAGGVCAWLYVVAAGAYYVAVWTTTVCVALLALVLLSVPRRIILGEEELELRCLVETTYIPLRSIVDVEVVEGSGLSHRVPLLGVYGLWGYYGRYLDLRSWHILKVYATRRSGCVAINTTKSRYVVSCNAPQLLRTMVLEAKSRVAQE